jgi:probable HAF family extracellular repeat protein
MNGHWNLRTIVPLSLLVGLSALVTPVQGQTPQFTVTDLGALNQPGGGLGWRLIQFQNGNYLPSLGGTGGSNAVYASYPFLAVGSSWAPGPDGGSVEHAALWRWDTGTWTVTDIGVLPGAVSANPDAVGPYSAAVGVNGVGDVVGYSDTAYEANHPGAPLVASHAFLWNNGVIHDLGTLANDTYNSTAEAVNDSHEVVGSSQAVSSADGSVLNRAFFYANGTMYNLSFFLVNAATIRLTDATAISCQGNISAVGYDTTVGADHPHAYLLIRQGPARTCPP